MNAPATRTLAHRIADTFAAPRRLFARFDEDTPWFDVLAISTLAAVAAATLLPDQVFLAQVENPTDRLGRPVVVTSSPATIAHFGRYMAMLSALAGHPILAFGLAGVLVLIFTVLGGGGASYRTYLAVVSHSLLIPALGTLIVIGATALMQTPLSANLAMLAPGLPEGSLAQRLLTGINPFIVWMLLILGLGVSEVDGRRRWMGASAILLLLYLLLDVSTALFTA